MSLPAQYPEMEANFREREKITKYIRLYLRPSDFDQDTDAYLELKLSHKVELGFWAPSGICFVLVMVDSVWLMSSHRRPSASVVLLLWADGST